MLGYAARAYRKISYENSLFISIKLEFF